MSNAEEIDRIINEMIDKMNIQTTLPFKDLYRHSIAYGQVTSISFIRKWWNPLRWTRGKLGFRLVEPKDFYVGPKRWWEFWK